MSAVVPLVKVKKLVWLIGFPEIVEVEDATAARSMLATPRSAMVCSSPLCVTASPFASTHILSVLQAESY